MIRQHLISATSSVTARLVVACALLLAAVAAISAPSVAAPGLGIPGQQAHIRAALDAETLRPAPGDSVDIAISMRPDARWHGYWKNGGDAGFGMQVEWVLPRGVTIGELAYPVPDTLVIAGLMNHVFERPYALVAPLTIDPSLAVGTPLRITGNASWLACTDEVCVPEAGQLTIDLVVGDGTLAAADRARFDQYRGALPQPISADAHFALVGSRLRIGIPLPASLTLSDPHLFVETVRANEPGGGQIFTRNGDMLVVDMPAGSDANGASRIDALLRLADGRGLSITATPGEVPAGGTETARVAPAGNAAAETSSSATPDANAVDAGMNAPFDATLFFSALLGAIVGGLILNIMPCVFPILSIKALALARSGESERIARREGLAYTAGAVLTCLGLGTILLLLRAGGEAVGWAFQLQRPESVVLLIVLMAAMTANLLGLFEFSGNFGFGRASRSTAPGGGDSAAQGAFATGALAAFVATPCSGPFLGAALGATLALPAWAALPVFGGLGLGLALPFLLIALVPAIRSRLPKPGAWMATFRRLLALPIALTALALVWLLGRQVGPAGWLVGGALVIATLALGWWGGRLQRSDQPVSMALIAMVTLIVPASLLLPQPQAPGAPDGVSATAEAGLTGRWSAESEAAAIASGRPVFVYFTADWCVSCKVNEAAAINRDETMAAFEAAGVIVLVGDWTNADPAITRKLAAHGRNSVPLYLWYPAGANTPELLPQILTPAMLVDRASRL